MEDKFKKLSEIGEKFAKELGDVMGDLEKHVEDLSKQGSKEDREYFKNNVENFDLKNKEFQKKYKDLGNEVHSLRQELRKNYGYNH